MPFVLDNSVVIGWCFESQATEYSDRVLDNLNNETAFLPSLWVLEFSNILRKAIKLNKIDESRANDLITIIHELPINVDYTPISVAENLKLASQYGLTSYDAAYLELAIRLKLPIATGDEALKDAAIKAGVGLVV